MNERPTVDTSAWIRTLRCGCRYVRFGNALRPPELLAVCATHDDGGGWLDVRRVP